jgi:hypothetical protein
MRVPRASNDAPPDSLIKNSSIPSPRCSRHRSLWLSTHAPEQPSWLQRRQLRRDALAGLVAGPTGIPPF